jgi:hypothetical protein
MPPIKIFETRIYNLPGAHTAQTYGTPKNQEFLVFYEGTVTLLAVVIISYIIIGAVILNFSPVVVSII